MKTIKAVLGFLTFSWSMLLFASTPVKIYVQNIQAVYTGGIGICQKADKQAALTNFIKQNSFDFILTQEYDPVCDSLFNEIKSFGYLTLLGPGDSTLFYKTDSWDPINGGERVKTTFNTPDQWGHDGSRLAVLANFQNKQNPDTKLGVGTAHLCVAYPSSQCVINQEQAHENDFNTLINAINSETAHGPWVIAGDMNAPLDQKPPLITLINQNQATNISQLDHQAFDMAFYQGSAISNMVYTDTAPEIGYPGLSDHDGFTLEFNLD